jgi:hypothetical protein
MTVYKCDHCKEISEDKESLINIRFECWGPMKPYIIYYDKELCYECRDKLLQKLQKFIDTEVKK